MRRFLLADRPIDENDSQYQTQLADAYALKYRPLCRCRQPAVPMYIARIDNQYLIKRMPLTGRDHDPCCPSYEPPYELSGLGPLIGNAIRIDEATGSTILKLDFSLSKRGTRGASAKPLSAADTVHSEAKKLSLKAMLHYLWDVGELTEWTSHWAGKRGWGRVRSSLINAARQLTVRGGPLSDILFVPEVFHLEDKEEIAARRAAAITGAQTTGPGPRQLMIVVAEVKEFAAVREKQKIVVRHLPFPFLIEESAWKRLTSRYENELELWRSNEACHLIMIATFGISSAGIASVDELGLMIVNENWIPFESSHEQHLLERLSGSKRKCVKGLRYNLTRDLPIVTVTLPEQKPAPIAMFVVPARAGDDYEHALADMIDARPEITPWIWRVGEGEIPPLP